LLRREKNAFITPSKHGAALFSGTFRAKLASKPSGNRGQLAKSKWGLFRAKVFFLAFPNCSLGQGRSDTEVDVDRIVLKAARIMPPLEAGHHPVARRRAACGWSQAELARRADIPRTSVSAIEGDRLTPSVTAALALARVLECSVEELFGGGVQRADARRAGMGLETACRTGAATGRRR